MIPDKYFTPTRLLLLVTFFVFSFSKIDAQDANAAGKAVFIAKCASCHSMGKDATGPDLQKVLSRWDSDENLVKQWILNYDKLVKSGNIKAGEVAASRPAVMQIFEGQISDAELTAVIKYTNEWVPPAPPTTTDGGGKDGGGALMFGIISLILAIIALILMQVNSNLKKLSDEHEGIHRPEPVPFYKNKVYIALFSLFFLLLAVILQPSAY